MNKMNKAIATASILAMAAIPAAAFAQDVPPQTNLSKGAFSVNQAKVVPGTLGQITDFVNDETGKFITVKGRGLAPTDQNEIILAITNNTKIIDAKGKKVALKTIMDEQKAVKAFYSPAITKSLPARGTALTLVVQDQSLAAIDGTVSEVLDQGILVNGTNIYSNFEDSIILHFAKKTKLVDQNGKTIKASDIQSGMSVRAFYGPAVALSYPAQSTADFVTVNTEIAEAPSEEATGTNGVITDIEDNTITVVGQAQGLSGTQLVVLTVDEKTEIVNEEGKALTPNDLKADLRVQAYYPDMMTKIYPAQSHADKIVVQAAEAPKVEGTLQTSDFTSEGQVYVNVGSDDSTDNDIILTISEDTVIIPVRGGDTELRSGTKIIAYHSPVMTMSYPGKTHAEIIIVTDDSKAITPR